MQVPKLNKIVINMGVGEARENAKVLDAAIKDLETIAGQKAVVTRARKSVANFKLREGIPCSYSSARPKPLLLPAHLRPYSGYS